MTKASKQHFQIYHNPKCSKSRKALEILEEHGVVPEIILYLQTPPTPKEFVNLVKNILRLDSPIELIRTKEEIFQELELKGKELSLEEWGEIVEKYPRLLERPIIIKDLQEGLIGRPPEKINSFFE